jgi:hypothetical protein
VKVVHENVRHFLSADEAMATFKVAIFLYEVRDDFVRLPFTYLMPKNL